MNIYCDFRNFSDEYASFLNTENLRTYSDNDLLASVKEIALENMNDGSFTISLDANKTHDGEMRIFAFEIELERNAVFVGSQIYRVVYQGYK